MKPSRETIDHNGKLPLPQSYFANAAVQQVRMFGEIGSADIPRTCSKDPVPIDLKIIAPRIRPRG